MANHDSHPSEQELLLYTDGELSSRDFKRLRSHLALCPECHARVKEIETTLADFVQAQSQIQQPASDNAGPRALLKARMEELARSSGNVRWKHFRFALDARGLAIVCALLLIAVLGVQIRYLRNESHGGRRNVYAGLLPNPNLTPGSTRPVTFSDLCSSNSDDVVRAVPDRLRKKIFREYGLRGVPAKNYEMDYLITPGLGGSEDVRNLWPEPHYDTTWNSYVKDQLENRLHRMVCGGTISLSQAQKDIAGNWITAYKKYFHTDRPIPDPLPSKASSISTIPDSELPLRDEPSVRQLQTAFVRIRIPGSLHAKCRRSSAQALIAVGASTQPGVRLMQD